MIRRSDIMRRDFIVQCVWVFLFLLLLSSSLPLPWLLLLHSAKHLSDYPRHLRVARVLSALSYRHEHERKKKSTYLPVLCGAPIHTTILSNVKIAVLVSRIHALGKARRRHSTRKERKRKEEEDVSISGAPRFTALHAHLLKRSTRYSISCCAMSKALAFSAGDMFPFAFIVTNYSKAVDVKT